jgi:hypothetical protein
MYRYLKLCLKLEVIKSLQLVQFLFFVHYTCPWFPKEGTVNLEAWLKVGESLRNHYMVEGAKGMPIFYLCYVHTNSTLFRHLSNS